MAVDLARGRLSITESVLDKKNFGALIICKEILNVLSTMRNTLVKDIGIVSLPHRMFQWDVDSFQFRRELQDTTYVDVLELKPGHMMRMTKFDVDLENIMQILNAAISDMIVHKNIGLLYAKLANARRYIAIHNEILQEHKINSNEQQKLLGREKMFQMRETNMYITCTTEVNKVYDKCVDTILVYEPIAKRYILNHLKASFEVSEIKLGKSEKDLIKEIADLKRKLEVETLAFQNGQFVQNEIIQDLTKRINMMAVKYENDYEKVELEVNVKLAAKDSVMLKYRGFSEKLNHYRKMIPLLTEEAQMREIEKQAETETAAAEKIKPTKKAKGKGKQRKK